MVNKNEDIDLFSDYLKCSHCRDSSIIKRVKDKKINIVQLDRKTLNELMDMIYIIDKNNIKTEFKNDII